MRNLRRVRKEKKYTLRELADCVGVHYSLIHRWENGTRTPKNKKAIQRLEETLDEPIDYLLQEAEHIQK